MSQKLLDRISDELAKCLNHEANELQESINELTKLFEEYCTEFDSLKVDNDKTLLSAEKLLKANTGLVQSLKAIHIVLGSHRDKLKKFKNVPGLIKELDKFVLSESAIHAGAISELVERAKK